MFFAQVTVQLAIGDPRLDHRVGQLFIDFENPIHALEDHDKSPGINRRCGAVSPVFSFADRPQGDCMPIGNSHDGLDGLNRIGKYKPRGPLH